LVVLLIGFTGGVLLAYLGSEAGVFNVQAQAPQVVLVGQPFEVELTLHNTTSDEQQLVSIGVERDLLDQGLTLLETTPSHRQADELGGSRWVEYTFALQRRPAIPANETLRMRITMAATAPGRYEGSLTTWTNDQPRADYTSLKFTAIPHPAPWLGR
jgi:hypothetical protein